MYPWTFMLFLIATASLSYGISKYYEGENRPYEFGFNIGGHQHRHESKDKNGIIMGEFGFITGDGVYHVTAYATDENGNFKILFMKNIKIGLPGNQSTNALQLPKQPPPQNKITTVSPPQAVEPEKTKPLPLRPGDTRTCSGCAIPKEQIENQPVVNLREKSLNLNKMTNYMKNNVKEIVQARRIAPNQISESFTESRGDSPKVQPHSVSGPISTTNLRTQQRSQPEKPKKKPTGSTKQIGREIQSAQDKFNESPGGNNRTVQTRRMPPNQIFESFTENRGDSPKVRPHPVSGGPISTTNLQTQQRSQPEKPKKKPTGSTKQIGRGTHKLNESPGGNHRNVSVDRESLEQMRRAFVGLLYKFNYTVGFHGHHEKGDFVGSKDGGYYFVGRDGLRRNVEYVANEFGYQPYLTQEQAAGEDVPKKETEKEAGLKGYEFKWFSERE